MKTKAQYIAAFAVIACGLFGFTGCASNDAKNQESLLSAAGFKVRTPDTAEKQALYDTVPAYKVHRATANGKTFYVYKDEKKGVAYVGGEQEYQKYQELAVQQRIARDNYQAAQMNQQASMGWYNAWGPWPYWP